jgi:hypothetical protein
VAGAIVHTDGWRGYDGLEAMGYTHRKTVIATSNDPAHNAIPAQILPFSPTIPSNKRSDEMP